jgi:Fe-S cluster assembly protein SufD
MSSQVADRFSTLTAGFEAFSREPGFGTGALRRAREQAFERFVERGFPTVRDEEWRFTNVAPIAAVPFAPAAESAAPAPMPAGWTYADVAHRIVLVNGRVMGSPALPAGVSLRREAALTASPSSSAFVDLNAAFSPTEITIDVAAKAIVDEPIQILHITVGDGTAVMASPRLRVTVGEQAQVSFIESYVGTGSAASFTNAVSLFEIAAAAVVDHVKLQDELATAFHLASTFVRVARGGTFTSHAITLGGRIARNDISAILDGEGAECTLNGLYVADGETLVDTHTTIDHAMPHCPSHEVYKGILSGRARAVFNGKIIVRQDAQKTDAKQTNKALLLTDDAQINTKPQLEIFADDVKCTHGAAIGQLDEDALFYLRARGIAAHDARNLLIHAFAGEVIDGIKVESVRQGAMRRIEEKLSL